MTKVMLVDDDASMQVLIEQIVRRGGYDFCCAGNGTDGLEMLRAERPDFLILDVMLPDINGFEICEIVRGEGRNVPIMFLTATGDIVDKSITVMVRKIREKIEYDPSKPRYLVTVWRVGYKLAESL